MRRWLKRQPAQPAPHSFKRQPTSGRSAVISVLQQACQALVFSNKEEGRLNPKDNLIIRTAETADELAGLTAGFAASGLRAAAFAHGLSSAALSEARGVSAQPLPFVLHFEADGAGGGHDAYTALAAAGAFQLVAKDAQEAVDFALIAHRLAELSLNPGVCVQDHVRTAASLQMASLPDDALLDAFLGYPDDLIKSPTPAQAFLFGADRRRLPVLLDIDRPAGVGAPPVGPAAFSARAAKALFFHETLAQLAEQAMAEFAAFSGRRYARAGGYALVDATYIVVAQGAVVKDLEVVAAYLRKHEKIKAGVLNLSLLSPFPGDLISRMLKGKAGVTVLEQAARSHAEEGPLMAGVRTALEKAAENGVYSDETSAYPGYARFESASDRPRLFSGVFGEESPAFSDLRAVFLNMLPEGGRKRTYFLGVPVGPPPQRLPAVERQQQLIRAAYPHLERHTLAGGTPPPAFDPPYATVQWLATLDEPVVEAGEGLAAALFDTLGWHVQAQGQAGVPVGPQPVVYTLQHAPIPVGFAASPQAIDALVVTHAALLIDLAPVNRLKDKGLLLIGLDAGETRVLLPAAVRALVRSKQVQVFTIEAARLAKAVAADPLFAPALVLPALAGAFMAIYPALADVDHGALQAACGQRWVHVPKEHPVLHAALLKVMQDGEAGVTPALLEGEAEAEGAVVQERETPWTLNQSGPQDDTVFDLARFWKTTGYLLETGQAGSVPLDPFVAARIVPAGSSGFRSVAPFYERPPRLVAERCTACGTCWAVCPDAALPVTVQPLEALVETAFQRAGGTALIHLQRVRTPLVKQAHRLVAEGPVVPYRTLDALLQDAFDRLLTRLNPSEEQRTDLATDFERVREAAGAFPIVKTATFFEEAEQKQKGAGLLFSLVVDPDACKACGLCVEACPEEALEVNAGDEAAEARTARQFLEALPEVPVDRLMPFVDADTPETAVYYLLNRRAYYSLVGGDLAQPGDGLKTALHLAAAAAESWMPTLVTALTQKTAALAGRVEERIQALVAGALAVNDFEKLARRLSALETEHLEADALAGALAKDNPEVDLPALRHFTALRNALRAVEGRYEEGRQRARMAVAAGFEDTGRWSGVFPYNPFFFPWIYSRLGMAPGVTAGAYEGLLQRMAETFKPLREAALRLDDAYEPATHDPFFARFSRHDFSAEEWAACPPFFLVAERLNEGVAALLQGGLPIKVLVPSGTETPDLLAFAPPGVFVFQGTTGFPGHLLKGLREGIAFQGPALFHVYVPDPGRHGLAPAQGFAQAQRAVQSRAFPLFTYQPPRADEARGRLDLTGNPDVEADWAVEPETGFLQTVGDWAAREGRFRHAFDVILRRDWGPERLPLSGYLALPPEEREGRVPYVERRTSEGAAVRLSVSPELVERTAVCLRAWRRLQTRAGLRLADGTVDAGQADAVREAALGRQATTLKTDYEARLAAMEAGHAQEYRALLTEHLLALSGFGPGDEEAQQPLHTFLQSLNLDP